MNFAGKVRLLKPAKTGLSLLLLVPALCCTNPPGICDFVLCCQDVYKDLITEVSDTQLTHLKKLRLTH